MWMIKWHWKLQTPNNLIFPLFRPPKFPEISSLKRHNCTFQKIQHFRAPYLTMNRNIRNFLQFCCLIQIKTTPSTMQIFTSVHGRQKKRGSVFVWNIHSASQIYCYYISFSSDFTFSFVTNNDWYLKAYEIPSSLQINIWKIFTIISYLLFLSGLLNAKAGKFYTVCYSKVFIVCTHIF